MLTLTVNCALPSPPHRDFDLSGAQPIRHAIGLNMIDHRIAAPLRAEAVSRPAQHRRRDARRQVLQFVVDLDPDAHPPAHYARPSMCSAFA